MPNTTLPNQLPDRNIDLSQTPPLALSNGSTPPASPQTIDQFNTAVQGLLKQYQTMGTKPFAVQGFNAQELQNNRILAAPPSNMVGASPSQQNSVRSASSQAVSPTIQGAQNSQQTFGEQLNSFGNSIKDAQNFMQSYQANQANQKSQAQSIIHDAIAGGSDALTALIQSQPDLVKLAGYSPETLQGMVTGLKKNEQATAAANNAKNYQVVPAGSAYVDANGKLLYNNPTTAAQTNATSPYKVLPDGSIVYNAQTGQTGAASNPKDYNPNVVLPDGSSIINTQSNSVTGNNPKGNAPGQVASPSGYPSATLAPGSADSANVKKLQDYLVAQGYMSQAQVNTGYGVYGPQTTAAVAAMQNKLGVDNTGAVGYYGPKTIAALGGTSAGTTPAPKKTLSSNTYGTQLGQAKEAISAGVNQQAAKQKFLNDNGNTPAANSAWNAYFPKASSGALF